MVTGSSRLLRQAGLATVALFASAVVANATTIGTPMKIFQPTGAVATQEGMGTNGVISINRTIDQSGLAKKAPDWTAANLNTVPDGYVSGVDGFQDYLAGDPLHLCNCVPAFGAPGSIGQQGPYEFESGDVNADSFMVTYDLGSVMDVGAIALWNEDFVPVYQFDLSYSVDGLSFTALDTFETEWGANRGEINYFLATFFRDYTADAIYFDQFVTAQYIKLTMNTPRDGFGNALPGDCEQSNTANGPRHRCNFGEVAFGAISEVPVPAALPLFLTGLGLLGWMGYRRRAAA